MTNFYFILLILNLCHFEKFRTLVLYSLAILSLVFRWGWHYNSKQGPIPSEGVDWIPSTTYIGHAFLSKHITHFVESVNPVLEKFQNHSLYPNPEVLFVPQFNLNKEFEWSIMYLRVLAHLFPKPLQIIGLQPRGKLICMKHAVCLIDYFFY